MMFVLQVVLLVIGVRARVMMEAQQREGREEREEREDCFINVEKLKICRPERKDGRCLCRMCLSQSFFTRCRNHR